MQNNDTWFTMFYILKYDVKKHYINNYQVKCNINKMGVIILHFITFGTLFIRHFVYHANSCVVLYVCIIYVCVYFRYYKYCGGILYFLDEENMVQMHSCCYYVA